MLITEGRIWKLGYVAGALQQPRNRPPLSFRNVGEMGEIAAYLRGDLLALAPGKGVSDANRICRVTAVGGPRGKFHPGP